MYAVTKSDTIMNIAYHEVTSLLTERSSIERKCLYLMTNELCFKVALSSNIL